VCRALLYYLAQTWHGHEPVVAGRKETRKQVTMHISRRAATIGAAIVIGLAALGAAFAAAATPAAHNRVQVLRLHTRDISDGGHDNVFTVVDNLRTPAGAEAGRAYLSCTQVTASVNLCHAAYVLKDGQIDVQVAVLPSVTNDILAVTGGTGIYAGVTGWARVDGADRTFHLIRPGQN
jgi:hypothetical protein